MLQFITSLKASKTMVHQRLKWSIKALFLLNPIFNGYNIFGGIIFILSGEDFAGYIRKWQIKATFEIILKITIFFEYIEIK